MSNAFATIADWATVFAAPDDALWRLEAGGYQPALEHEVEVALCDQQWLLGVRASLEQPMVRIAAAHLYRWTLRHSPRRDAASEARFRAGLVDDFNCSSPASRWPWRPARRLSTAGRSTSGAACYVVNGGSATQAGRTFACARCASFHWPAGHWPCRWSGSRSISRPRLRWRPGSSHLPNGLCLNQARTERAGLAYRSCSKTAGCGKHHDSAAECTEIQRVSGDVGRSIWRWNATPGQPAIFARIVAFARGDAEDVAASAAPPRPLRAAGAAERAIARLTQAHARAWAERWATSDVVVEGDPVAQKALRFACYHVISAAEP